MHTFFFLFLTHSFMLSLIVTRILGCDTAGSERGNGPLCEHGLGAPRRHLHSQTGAPQEPVPQLQEPEHLSCGALKRWRAAVPGKALHEKKLAHDTGMADWLAHIKPAYIQNIWPLEHNTFFCLFQPDNLAQKLPNLIELWVFMFFSNSSGV